MTQVRKRRVFYISGFDPRGVAAYHRLFAEESRKQAGWHGLTVEVGERRRADALSSVWRAGRPEAEGAAETTFEFLHWDDIVRERWQPGYRGLYRLALRVYWNGIFTTGLLARVFRVSKWPAVTGLAPALGLFGMPVLAVLAAWATFAVAETVFAQQAWAAPAAAAAAFALVAGAGLWLERAFALGWLLRTYAFVLDYGLGRMPELDARLDLFAQRIARYVEMADDDEIVVVGHSVGANLAVSVLARAAAINPDLWRRYRPVGLLTLGGTVPMLGLMPTAGTFRDELSLLAASRELHWVDMSAFEDAASFPLVNPLAASGITTVGDAGERPRVLSAEFRARLTSRTYYRAVWNLFRMHFQYLMASELELPDDYLAITTGKRVFRERFGGDPGAGPDDDDREGRKA
ncbi:MAG: hypothetical protein AB7O69_07165 [Burkholderiales bacterium]